jgi:hypothetical protein
MIRVMGILLAIVFAILSFFHLYWAAGGRFGGGAAIPTTTSGRFVSKLRRSKFIVWRYIYDSHFGNFAGGNFPNFEFVSILPDGWGQIWRRCGCFVRRQYILSQKGLFETK